MAEEREIVTVIHQGMPLMTSPDVLEKLGLSRGQTIDEKQLWSIISLNALNLADECDQRRSAGEKDIPDTSGLRRRADKILRMVRGGQESIDTATPTAGEA